MPHLTFASIGLLDPRGPAACSPYISVHSATNQAATTAAAAETVQALMRETGGEQKGEGERGE